MNNRYRLKIRHTNFHDTPFDLITWTSRLRPRKRYANTLNGFGRLVIKWNEILCLSQVIRMLFVIIVEFFVCWAPIHILNTVNISESQSTKLSNELTVVFFLHFDIGIPIFAYLSVPPGQQHRHCIGSTDGLCELMLQSYHLLLHESKISSSVPINF
jgi:hypothetical protein